MSPSATAGERRFPPLFLFRAVRDLARSEYRSGCVMASYYALRLTPSTMSLGLTAIWLITCSSPIEGELLMISILPVVCIADFRASAFISMSKTYIAIR